MWRRELASSVRLCGLHVIPALGTSSDQQTTRSHESAVRPRLLAIPSPGLGWKDSVGEQSEADTNMEKVKT